MVAVKAPPSSGEGMISPAWRKRLSICLFGMVACLLSYMTLLTYVAKLDDAPTAPKAARGATASASISIRKTGSGSQVAKLDNTATALTGGATASSKTIRNDGAGGITTIIWAYDEAPDPRRFEVSLQSLLLQSQKNKVDQIQIYCGSTACLLSAHDYMENANKAMEGNGNDDYEAHPIVKIIRLNALDLAQDTPIEEWANYHVLVKLRTMHHYEHQLQDAMLIAALYKYGGSVLALGSPAIVEMEGDADAETDNGDYIARSCESSSSSASYFFRILQAAAPNSKLATDLANVLLKAHSWDGLSLVLGKMDMPLSALPIPNSNTWPIRVKWQNHISVQECSKENDSASQISFQDGKHLSPGHSQHNSNLLMRFFGTMGYDDRRRQLMAKKIKTMNIGDETQGLAGIQMLPRIDAFVERDKFSQVTFPPDNTTSRANFFHKNKNDATTTKMVLFMNAWYGIPAMEYPPPSFLEPITLAMHFQERMYEKILEPIITNNSAPYLQAHAPIGARDTKTLEFFQKHGIHSFFSACMTMTLGLQRLPSKQQPQSVLIIDAPELEELRGVVPADILANATFLTQDLVGPMADSSISRYFFSFYRLLRYPGAKLIITARLHVALPAVALGTPVVFVHSDTGKLPGGGGHRMDGLDKFMHEVRGSQQPQSPCFDWYNPPPNPRGGEFANYRSRLKQVSVCHAGVSDAARKFGIIPTDWDAGDEWTACSSSGSGLINKNKSKNDNNNDESAIIRIATTLDANYLDLIFPSWANALSQSNPDTTFEFYILTVNLTPKQRCLVRTVVLNLLPRTQVFTIPVDVTEFEAKFTNKGKHISVSTQSRLKLPSILPCIDKIAYIDLDAFVLKPLTKFWSYEVSPCGITARLDTVKYLNVNGFPNWSKQFGYSFNAGVMLLSLETLRQTGFEKNIVHYWGIEMGYNDQVVLNLACNGTQGILNETMNMLQGENLALKPNPNINWVTHLYHPPPEEWVILHYQGSRKPWGANPMDPEFLHAWKKYKLPLLDALDQKQVDVDEKIDVASCPNINKI